MPTEEDVREGLKQLRRLRAKETLPSLAFGAIFLISLASAAWAFSANSPTAERLWMAAFKYALVPTGILFVLAALYSAFRDTRLVCPCCGKAFHAREFGRLLGLPFSYQSHYSRHCLNCGLKMNGKNVTKALAKAEAMRNKELNDSGTRIQ